MKRSLPLILLCLLTAWETMPAQGLPEPSPTPSGPSSLTPVEWPRTFTEPQFREALQRALAAATPGIVQAVLAVERPKRVAAEAERDAALALVILEVAAKKRAEVWKWVAVGGGIAGTVGGVLLGVWIAK